MQCQKCKEHVATIHLTEIDNGQRNETHLCQNCAQQQGLTLKAQVPLNELLSTLLAAQSENDVNAEVSQAMASGTQECPTCGMTLERFSKDRLLGCPYDYELFDKPLAAIIEQSQNGNTHHSGKVPSNTPDQGKKQIEIINLRNQLDEAIRNEDYEKAALLRDEIGHLQ